MIALFTCLFAYLLYVLTYLFYIMMIAVDWFTLLIGCGLLMAIIAVLVIVDTYFELHSSNDTLPNPNPSPNLNTNTNTNPISISNPNLNPNPNTSTSTTLGFKNTVVINNKQYHNEATEYARSLLITSLLDVKHDSISQYMPVHLYASSKDITDRFEYHSLIEVKSIAIAIRLLLANNNPEPLSIDQLIVKSKEGKDLFILEQELQIEPYQYLYLVWYIQLAGDNITEQGIAQLLTALAYGNTTQYKHSTLKDVVLLDDKGNILPFYLLAFKIEGDNNNDNEDNNDDSNNNNSNNTIHISAILKNNTAKDLTVKTIAVRNTNLDYIFAYDLEEALLARAYSKIAIKVEIQS